MRLVNLISIAPGLGAFGVVILWGVLALNNPSPLYVMLFGIAVVALAPTGFEFCRSALGSGDDGHRLFSSSYRVYIFDIVILLLAICLTAATVNYQRSSSLLCDGRLSGGFPVAFICDASGESPLSSVGKIDRADVDSIELLGSFADVLFYMLILSIARLAVRRLSAVAGHPPVQVS